MDPPIHGEVVDLDPAPSKELLDISVGQAEPQIPTDRQGDDLRWEAIPSEG
jgi:hypothetical protein